MNSIVRVKPKDDPMEVKVGPEVKALLLKCARRNVDGTFEFHKDRLPSIYEYLTGVRDGLKIGRTWSDPTVASVTRILEWLNSGETLILSDDS